jgi:capsular polysaccharide biosynthesis protein
VTTPASNAGPGGHGFDPEAEQEVDFARYGRMLAVRWWLLAAGVVAGAVIGYLVSLGGTQVYSATATIYLGQPYSPTGAAPVNTPQTNPSAVGTVIQQQVVKEIAANACHTKVAEFQNGISTQSIATGAAAKGSQSQVTPLVTVSVQTKKGKIATCVANQLSDQVVTRLGIYPAAQIANYEAHISFDKKDIKTIELAIAGSTVSTTDKLILQTTLRSDQLDLTTNSGLLLEAKNVELPQVITPAAAHRITARSRRNTVVISALIGLILGALAALLWDRVVPRLTPRNGNGV